MELLRYFLNTVIPARGKQEQASATAISIIYQFLWESQIDFAGHCAFTPAETLTAFQTLIQRLNSGQWEDSTNPDLMNQEATALGPLNVFSVGSTPTPTPPAFLHFEPTLFLRPFPSHGLQ